MRATPTVLVVLAALLGCDGAKKNSDAELTIVVEADKSKLQNEERLLQAQRDALEEERKRLAAEQEQIEQERSSIGKVDEQTRLRLEEKMKGLAAREREAMARSESLESSRKELERQKQALTGAPAVVAAASPEVRERALASREHAIAAREAEVAVREKSIAAREADVARREKDLAALLARPIAAPPPEPGTRVLSRKEIEARHRKVLADMEQRGVLVSDLPVEAQGYNSQIFEAKAGGDYARATSLLQRLTTAAAAVKVDKDLIERKMARLSEMRADAKIDAKVKAEVDKLFQRVTREYNDSQYGKANQGMNRIAVLLEKH